MAYGANNQIMSASEAQGKDTNAIMGGWVDRGPWFYYDTFQATAGSTLAAQYNMFTVSQGQQNPLTGGTTKTKLQTNMVGPGGQFQPPRCLLLMQIGFHWGGQPVTSGGITTWTPMTLQDITALNYGSYFEFKIDDKTFHEGPMYEYPSAAGTFGATSQSGQQVWSNGVPMISRGKRFGDWSKYIAPIQLFQCILYFPGTPPTLDANGPGAYVPIIFDGLTDRSVQ